MIATAKSDRRLLVDREYETLSFSLGETQMTLDGPSGNYDVTVKDVKTGEVFDTILYDQMNEPYQRFRTEKSLWPGAELDMVPATS